MAARLFWSRYITYCTCSLFSMFAGAQVVHKIYKPLDDLPEYIERERVKLKKFEKESIM